MAAGESHGGISAACVDGVYLYALTRFSNLALFTTPLFTDTFNLEVGVVDSFKKKLARIRLKWADHVKRMGDEKLSKRSDAKKVVEDRGRQC